VANNTSGPVGWAVLLALWTICSTGAANAQAPSPRSQINNAIERPTVSPYLNLFNNNGGRSSSFDQRPINCRMTCGPCKPG
jgi:hypothetical protein